MNEAETRAEHIDPALAAAGWGVVAGSRIRREYGITPGCLQGNGQRARAEVADYVLVYRNTPLAVLEAKARDKPHTEGLAQAKGYAQRLALRFAYASNGQAIYRADMQTGDEGDVAGYPTPQELWDATFAQASAWRDRFAAVPFEDRGGSWQPRYYQDVAMQCVLQAMAQGRDRILLTLATGTGKTAIAFQLAWKLFHARWNLQDWKHEDAEPARRPRILFLADRNILADQAFNAFSAFDEDALVRIAPDEIRRKGRVPRNGSIFFTIFQTFMSGPPGADGQPQPYFGAYPPNFFDFIVIDECHRGGANDESSWRAILEYFAPAVHLGLTATPRRDVNVDTYGYFGDPVYQYSLKDGINDGFLTPFRVVQIATTLDDYAHTPDDEVLAGQVEPGRRYAEADFNRIIRIREREAYRVGKLMGLINPQDKTLVFCATQEHALAVRDLINQQSGNSSPDYCHRVTANDGVRGEQWLRDFQDNEKTLPTILTTSRKLSTGVDARNVRNIVLLRPVRSMIEFKQIIGRGTRLYEGKDHFTIYDFVKAHHHFSDPEWDGEPLQPELPGARPAGGPYPLPEPGQSPTFHEPQPQPAMLEVRLADGKKRLIQSMTATSFWGADGKPMSAAQFLESLFGALPGFFHDEDELRALWSEPATRRKLLDGLAEQGFGPEPLAQMQKLIAAEDSDFYDVLAHVAFASGTQTRQQRAQRARQAVRGELADRQQGFVDFVLAQYVRQGVDELDEGKLAALLKLRYGGLNDAVRVLGGAAQVRQVFIGFQRHLYAARAGAAPHPPM